MAVGSDEENMKKIILLAISIVLLTGCIQKQETINPTPAAATPETTPTPTPFPETERLRFIRWISEDKTDQHTYILWGNESTGWKSYLCSNFANDFIDNATIAGFEVYAAGLNEVPDRGKKHAIAVVIFNDTKEWFFVEPQTDEILTKEKITQDKDYSIYKWVQFGRRFGQSQITIENPITEHPIIGLNGSSWMKLKEA